MWWLCTWARLSNLVRLMRSSTIHNTPTPSACLDQYQVSIPGTWNGYRLSEVVSHIRSTAPPGARSDQGAPIIWKGYVIRTFRSSSPWRGLARWLVASCITSRQHRQRGWLNWLRKLNGKDLEQAKTARLELISHLDAIHEKQQISEKVYNRLRKEQTEKLSTVLKQVRENA